MNANAAAMPDRTGKRMTAVYQAVRAGSEPDRRDKIRAPVNVRRQPSRLSFCVKENLCENPLTFCIETGTGRVSLSHNIDSGIYKRNLQKEQKYDCCGSLDFP